MSAEGLLAFALAMVMLAASPGPGLGTVIARSATFGKMAGARVVVGLVLADFLFLGLAIAGVNAISQAMGPFFQVLKYVGAAYLIYLGVQTFLRAGTAITPLATKTTKYGAVKDVSIGIFVTLGNPKAILFYSALLPTFFEVSKFGVVDFVIVGTIIALASGMVYGLYIFTLSQSLQSESGRSLLLTVKRTAGVTLVGSGIAVASR